MSPITTSLQTLVIIKAVPDNISEPTQMDTALPTAQKWQQLPSTVMSGHDEAKYPFLPFEEKEI